MFSHPSFAFLLAEVPMCLLLVIATNKPAYPTTSHYTCQSRSYCHYCKSHGKSHYKSHDRSLESHSINPLSPPWISRWSVFNPSGVHAHLQAQAEPKGAASQCGGPHHDMVKIFWKILGGFQKKSMENIWLIYGWYMVNIKLIYDYMIIWYMWVNYKDFTSRPKPIDDGW